MSKNEMSNPFICWPRSAVSAIFTSCQKTDFAVSTHRCHTHYLGKGGSLKKMISELYGKKTGCSGGKRRFYAFN